MHKKQGKILRALLCAAVITTTLVIGGGTANAAGIKCLDIGNGLLCSNTFSKNRFDVWYDKHAGPTLEVGLAYWDPSWGIEFQPGVSGTGSEYTVSAGERIFHSFYGDFPATRCYTPKLYAWYTHPQAGDPFNGVYNCPQY